MLKLSISKTSCETIKQRIAFVSAETLRRVQKNFVLRATLMSVLLVVLYCSINTEDVQRSGSFANTKTDSFLAWASPIAVAIAGEAEKTDLGYSVATSEGSASIIEPGLSTGFAQAGQFIAEGKIQGAIELLNRLIDQHPEQTELYSNLASLQAGNGKLEQARITLLRGLNSNTSFANLFENLQKVQGALAANAYNIALAGSDEPISTVNLPLITRLNLPIDQAPRSLEGEQQIMLLKEQLSQTRNKLSEVEQEQMILIAALQEERSRQKEPATAEPNSASQQRNPVIE